MPNSDLARAVQEAIDNGSSFAQLERTLLADGDTDDDVAAAWLYAWAYAAVRPAGQGRAAIADGVAG